ncbi:alcohol dehydrogenase catalytic domain-containing protein [Chloroflexota bacterium]
MKIKAAVLYEPKTPLKVEEVDLDEPKEGEVLVKLVGTGVCHTDLSVANGNIKMPMPIVLGHEGGGIVEKTGPGVTRVKPGDHVVLTGGAFCGKCRYCAMGKPILCEVFRPILFQGILPGGQKRLHKDGQDLSHFFVQSSFAEYSVAPEEAAIKVRDDAPLDIVCILGCGAITGIGSVINTAQVEVGSSTAIFGCGGVGMSALLAAKAIGAGKIIVVDILDSKLKMAKELGATHTINATLENPVERIAQITGDGADYSFVAILNKDVIIQAIMAIRPGGQCTIIAGIPRGEYRLDNLGILHEKIIKGCRLGSVRAGVDIPAYVDLFMDGRLPLDKLVMRSYPLSEVNSAFEALEKGEVIKSVIAF